MCDQIEKVFWNMFNQVSDLEKIENPALEAQTLRVLAVIQYLKAVEMLGREKSKK